MTRIPFPSLGMSEILSHADQPPLTSPLIRNCRVRDPITGRMTGASRGGMSPFHTGGPLNAAPVKRIQQVVYDLTRQTYTTLGDAGVLEWSKGGPTLGACRGVVMDTQNNRYCLDGASGLAKFNADGFQLWKIALPCEDGKHIVRGLCVDSNTGFIYVGVSADGKPETARLWTYRQKDDEETELVEQIEPGGYTEALAVYQSELYALQNFPQRGRAYVQVYSAINSGVLEVGKRWEVPYPGNDLAVSPKDGTVFVASDANTQRGLDPRSPFTTSSSEDWTPKDLTDFNKRVWSWHDASDRSTFSLAKAREADPDDGSEVVEWRDKMGSGRSWLANRGISAYPPVPDTEAGPLYRAEGINGYPTLSFDGALYNGSATASTSGRSMVGRPPSSTDRSYRRDLLSPLPTYKGAQFALFMVFRAGLDEVIRGLLSIPTPTSPADRFRGLSINRRDDNNLPGTIPMPGSVSLNEYDGIASDSGQSSPSAGGPSGPNTVSPGALSGSGVCVLTWICDGGVHDGNTANLGTGTSTRSTFRINGHPIDRWQSGAFSTLESITLGLAYLGSSGHSRFAGEIGEMLVLSDWYNQTGTQQRLITVPTYPDSIWAANSDTEVERIEGYLAHKWGIAHELESGQAAWLTITQPANGETLTIDSTTYTFRTSLTAANDIKIGSTLRETGSNLYTAINRIGQPGVDYDQRTEKHDGFIAYAAIETNTSPITTMAIRSISPYAARVTLTASSGGAMTWTAATTQHTIAGSGTARGWYPHPFTLKKTTNSRGGPPANQTNTQGQISPQYLLQSIYPSVSKWQPTTGRPVWVATSGYDVVASVASNKITTAGSGLGGVGYGVRIGSEGQVFTAGPRRAVVSGDEAIIADAMDLRKFGDTGTAFTTADAALGDPWSAALFNSGSTPNALTYAYPRMDVDEFDNVYLPISYVQTAGSADPYANVSFVGYRDASTGVAVGVEFTAYESLPNDQEAYAIAADKRKPSFPTGDTVQHMEFVTVGTEPFSSDTAKLSIFNVRLIATANQDGSNRAHVILAVCGGDVVRLALNAAPVVVIGGDAGLGGGMDSLAPYIDAVELFGKIYLCDGKVVKVYDPKTDTLALHTSETGGLIPSRAQLLGSWRGRLILLAFKDNPHNWAAAEKDKPKGWDLSPFTSNDTQAIQGVDSEVGLSPDIVRTFIPLTDDLSIWGCDHSIYRMTGDPATPGCQFHPISTTIGMAHGRSWCKDPQGRIHFFGNQGGIYAMDQAGLGFVPLTDDTIPKRMASIDLEAFRVEMAWSVQEQALRVVVVTATGGGVHTESFCLERLTPTGIANVPSVDEYGPDDDTGIQPSCIYTVDGDDPDDRLTLFGCEDGSVRYYDPAALDDDGEVIDSSVTFGPLVPEESDSEFMVTDLDIVTAKDQAGPNWYLYASSTADSQGEVKQHGFVRPGRAPTVKARARGAVLWIRLGLASLTGRWSLESLTVRFVKMGRKAGFLA